MRFNGTQPLRGERDKDPAPNAKRVQAKLSKEIVPRSLRQTWAVSLEFSFNCYTDSSSDEANDEDGGNNRVGETVEMLRG